MVSANPALRAGLLGTQRSVCVRGVAEPKAPALCVGSFGLFLSKKGPGRGPSEVERDACAACLLRAGDLAAPGPRGRHAPAGGRPRTLDTYLPRPPCAPGGPRPGARALLHLRPLEGTRCSRTPFLSWTWLPARCPQTCIPGALSGRWRSVSPFLRILSRPSDVHACFSGLLRLLAVMGCSEWDRAQLCLAFLLSASLLA